MTSLYLKVNIDVYLIDGAHLLVHFSEVLNHESTDSTFELLLTVLVMILEELINFDMAYFI